MDEDIEIVSLSHSRFKALEILVHSHLEAAFELSNLSNYGINLKALNELTTNIIFVLYKDRYLELNDRLRYGEYHKKAEMAESTLEADRRTFDRAIHSAKARKAADATRLGLPFDYHEEVLSTSKQDGDLCPYYHIPFANIKAISNYAPSTVNMDIVKRLSGGKIVGNKVSGKEVSEAYDKLFDYAKEADKITNSTQWIEALIDFADAELECMPVFLYAMRIKS